MRADAARAGPRAWSRSAGDRAPLEPLRVGEAWRHERRRLGSHRRGSLERLALGDGENLGDVVEAPNQASPDLDRGGAIVDPFLAYGRLRETHPQRFVNEPLHRFLRPDPLPS